MREERERELIKERDRRMARERDNGIRRKTERDNGRDLERERGMSQEMNEPKKGWPPPPALPSTLNHYPIAFKTVSHISVFT